MLRSNVPFLLLFLAAAACAPAAAPPPAGPPPAHVSAAVTEAPLAFDVAQSGEGRPMLLIPGLGCSGEVWRETVAHYEGRYRLHVVTIHGFAGTPAFDGPFLETVRRDLARYIRAQRLVKPIVVGHSIGGTLAYALAASEPALVGPVIAVDGVPFLPALFDPTATPETARSQAEKLGGMIGRMNAQQRAAADRRNAAQMVVDPARVEQIARWVDASDAGTLARAIADAYGTDLRRPIAKIESPVLLVGEEVPFGDEATAREAYEAQVSSIPRHTVAIAKGSRHFVMYDAPQILWKEMDLFLAANRGGS